MSEMRLFSGFHSFGVKPSYLKIRTKGAVHNMSTFLIILVMITFLAAIFTAGYNDKPGTNK